MFFSASLLRNCSSVISSNILDGRICTNSRLVGDPDSFLTYTYFYSPSDEFALISLPPFLRDYTEKAICYEITRPD